MPRMNSLSIGQARRLSAVLSEISLARLVGVRYRPAWLGNGRTVSGFAESLLEVATSNGVLGSGGWLERIRPASGETGFVLGFRSLTSNEVLKLMFRRHQMPQCLVSRSRIVSLFAKGHTSSKNARRVGIDRGTGCLRRACSTRTAPVRQAAPEKGVARRDLTALLQTVLSDAFRCKGPLLPRRQLCVTVVL